MRSSTTSVAARGGNSFAMRLALSSASLALPAAAQTPQWIAAERTELLPAVGVTGGDEYGRAVAISGDVAAIGAWLDDPIGGNSGAVYVFRRNGSSWAFETQLQQQNQVSPPNAAQGGDAFGVSIDIDGDTMVIGAHGDDQPAFDAGSAYVFVHNGSSWVQQAILSPSTGTASDYCGWDVALGGDVIVLGAYGDDPGGKVDAGSAYVFARNENGTPLDHTDDTWCQQANLAPASLLAGDQFGYSVAASPDGSTIAVGAWLDDVISAGDSGSVYVFGRNDNGTPSNPCDDTWVQEGGNIVNLSNAAGDNFGRSLAVEDDTLIVGASLDDYDTAGPGNCGSFVLVERLPGPVWVPVTKVFASDAGSGDQFGIDVALNGDTLLVGSWGDSGVLANNNEGSAYWFRRNTSGVWQQQLKLFASDGTFDDLLGSAVGVDGDHVILGAYGDDTFGSTSGTAYAFEVQRDRFATFCHGDGSGPACPCSNNSVAGASQGCKNTLGRGATLRPGGSTSIAANDLALYATNLPVGNACVLFGGMGSNAGLPFFAGLKCVPPPTLRLGLKTASTYGYVAWGPNLNNGYWSAGQTWNFQVWYRDPTFTGCSPIKTTNVTNGVQVTF